MFFSFASQGFCCASLILIEIFQDLIGAVKQWMFLHCRTVAAQMLTLLPNTRPSLQLCQPSSFFPISVLMYLETKVESKREEAASVSSLSTKISPRYDCHCGSDSTPTTCGQIHRLLCFYFVFL